MVLVSDVLMGGFRFVSGGFAKMCCFGLFHLLVCTILTSPLKFCFYWHNKLSYAIFRTQPLITFRKGTPAPSPFLTKENDLLNQDLNPRTFIAHFTSLQSKDVTPNFIQHLVKNTDFFCLQQKSAEMHNEYCVVRKKHHKFYIYT